MSIGSKYQLSVVLISIYWYRLLKKKQIAPSRNTISWPTEFKPACNKTTTHMQPVWWHTGNENTAGTSKKLNKNPRSSSKNQKLTLARLSQHHQARCCNGQSNACKPPIFWERLSKSLCPLFLHLQECCLSLWHLRLWLRLSQTTEHINVKHTLAFTCDSVWLSIQVVLVL